MKRTTTLASFFAAAVFGIAAAGFVGCTSILGDFEVSPNPTGEGGVGTKANGAACANGSDCASSFCTDGVCCESSCSGTCESCKIDPGKCVPVPDGQNPDNECKPEPLPDAGPTVEPDAEPPPVDAGDGGVAEGGQPDASGEINLPDGGVTTDETKCSVGVCNGARACKFPGKETSCGTQFCNSATQAAGYQCDGKGHCGLDVQTCSSFVCENNECRVDCASNDDCQSTHFCDADLKCKSRKANGITCGNPNECQSGFCVVEGGSGVCCNSECSPGEIPGATCKQAGSVGSCKCSSALGCGANACRLFYKDSDNDTFGDKGGSVALGTAVAGCEGATPPTGFSASKTDCDDGDSNVRPNQTGYFPTPNARVGFDYNCDGAEQKYYPEYDGSSCQFCYVDRAGTACNSSGTCSTASDQSRLLCKPYKSILIGGGFTCGYGTPKGPTNTAGFTTTVGCGVSSSSYRTCGKCTTKSGAPTVTNSTVQQLCH